MMTPTEYELNTLHKLIFFPAFFNVSTILLVTDWGYPHAWQYAKLNSTFKDTIVQFGRSVDADYELRETTFSHFLKNLIGQTDLRGEPW